jgi:hypothetical protein
MRRAPQWQVQRSGVPHLDGARRWDTAYQLLLAWAHVDTTMRQALSAPHHQEEEDADRTVCTGLDQRPAADPDD